MLPHPPSPAEPATCRSRTFVAGLWCAAAAAVALTAYVVVLIVQWNLGGPAPSGAALLLVSLYAGWGIVEALAAWVVLVHILRGFPYGRRTSIGMLAGVAAMHALLTATLAGAAPWMLVVVGAAVPLAGAAAVLLARAPACRTERHNTP